MPKLNVSVKREVLDVQYIVVLTEMNVVAVMYGAS